MKLFSRFSAVIVFSWVSAFPVFAQGLVEYAIILNSGVVVINTGETAGFHFHTSCSDPFNDSRDPPSFNDPPSFTYVVTNIGLQSCRQTIKVPATLSCGLSTVRMGKGFGFISVDDGSGDGPIETQLKPCFDSGRVRIAVGRQLGPDQADAIAEQLAARPDKLIPGMPTVELVTVSDQAGNTRAAWTPSTPGYYVLVAPLNGY